jgi:hypothetical protein
MSGSEAAFHSWFSLIPFVIHSFLIIGRVYQCFVIPFRLAFKYADEAFGYVDVILYTFDFLFIVDIFIKFRWGFIENGTSLPIYLTHTEMRIRSVAPMSLIPNRQLFYN